MGLAAWFILTYMTNSRLRRINFVLLGLIVAVNLYTIALPFLPGLMYWFESQDNTTITNSVPAYIKATQHTNQDGGSNTEQSCTQKCLIIPRMMLNTSILEGPESNSFNLLKQGVWHLPFSVDPGEEGNTVLAAHRFSYTGPRGLFYYLDKLRVGDEIGVQWGDKLLRYRVESSRTVLPTEVSVQQPTNDTRLTLYTCTPLFNPVNRLVVVAKPIEGATP